MTKKYVVYKIILDLKRTYIGATKDLKRRIGQHKSSFPKRGIVFMWCGVIKYYDTKEECATAEAEAIKKEMKINKHCLNKHSRISYKPIDLYNKTVKPSPRELKRQQHWEELKKVSKI